MKYLYIKIAVVLSAVVALSSCDSFLDETPDNRLRLNSYETIAELVTNAYPEGSGVFMEWMSDNVGADPKNRHTTGRTWNRKGRILLRSTGAATIKR